MKGGFESIGAADKDELFPTVDLLVGKLCDRRALQPLRILLGSYPLAGGLTNDWAALHNALRDLENLSDVQTDERRLVTFARRIVQHILDNR